MGVSLKGVTKPLTLFQIAAVGASYSVACQAVREEPELLAVPVRTKLWLNHEKHINLTPVPCTITALCQTGALLESNGLELHSFDNIKLDTGGELFCKVLFRRGSGWQVHFTAWPAGFDKLMETCVKPNERLQPLTL